MLVNKVAGNFHIAMGETHTRGSGHIHQFNPFTMNRFNASHTLHALSFGLPYPGQKNPLDGSVRAAAEGPGVFMYFIKVIPTVYAAGGGAPALKTNQYSVTSQYRAAVVNGVRQNVLPGIFFVYDISPFQVTVTEHTTPTLQARQGAEGSAGGPSGARPLSPPLLPACPDAHVSPPLPSPAPCLPACLPAQMLTSLAAILGGVITAAGLLDSLLFHGLGGAKGLQAALQRITGGGAASGGAAATPKSAGTAAAAAPAPAYALQQPHDSVHARQQ